MMAMYVHTFTDEEAETLQSAIRGIRNAIAAWNRKTDRQKKDAPLRYEIDAEDDKLLLSMSAIHAGEEIELDSCTWTWLQVLLETWMYDAPARSLGSLWRLTGVFTSLVDSHPCRFASMESAKKTSVSTTQLSLDFA